MGAQRVLFHTIFPDTRIFTYSSAYEYCEAFAMCVQKHWISYFLLSLSPIQPTLIDSIEANKHFFVPKLFFGRIRLMIDQYCNGIYHHKLMEYTIFMCDQSIWYLPSSIRYLQESSRIHQPLLFRMSIWQWKTACRNEIAEGRTAAEPITQILFFLFFFYSNSDHIVKKWTNISFYSECYNWNWARSRGKHNFVVHSLRRTNTVAGNFSLRTIFFTSVAACHKLCVHIASVMTSSLPTAFAFAIHHLSPSPPQHVSRLIRSFVILHLLHGHPAQQPFNKHAFETPRLIQSTATHFYSLLLLLFVYVPFSPSMFPWMRPDNVIINSWKRTHVESQL